MLMARAQHYRPLSLAVRAAPPRTRIDSLRGAKACHHHAPGLIACGGRRRATPLLPRDDSLRGAKARCAFAPRKLSSLCERRRREQAYRKAASIETGIALLARNGV